MLVLYHTGGVVLIDMEYSDVNYAAFDIGAFFCEFAGKYLALVYEMKGALSALLS